MPQFDLFQTQYPPLPRLEPQEEDSLLSRLGGGILGGLGWFGSTLDKLLLGRAVRGVLGGRPHEALSAIPFSDVLGITDPSQAVSGADLLGLPKDTSLFSMGGLGGLGVEMLTSPASWLSFGGRATTALGEAARRAGVLPRTGAQRAAGVTGEAADVLANYLGKPAAEVAGQSLGGSVGWGLPWMGAPNLGTAVVPDWLNPMVQLARPFRGTQIGREIGSRFYKPWMEQTTPEGIAAAEAGAERLPLYQHALRRQVGDIGEELSKLGPEWRMPAQGQMIRQAFEHYLPGDLPDPLANAVVMKNQLAEGLLRQAHEAGQFDLPLQQKLFLDPYFGQTAGYTPRYTTPAEALRTGLRRLAPEQQRARIEKLKLPTEGPGSLRQLRDLDISGLNQPGQLEALIENDFLNVSRFPAQEQPVLRQMANWLADLKVNNKVPVFDNHPIQDWWVKVHREAARRVGSEAFQDALVRSADVTGDVSIAEVLKKNKLTGELVMPDGTQTWLGKMLDKHGKGMNIDQLFVPQEMADSFKRFLAPVREPTAFGQLFDGWTNLAKAWQTVLWPAYHTRNQFTALFQHFVHGIYDPTVPGGAWNPYAYVKPWLAARRLMRGEAIDEATSIFPNLPKEEGSRKLVQEINALDIPARYHQQAREGLKEAGTVVHVPGEPIGRTFGQALWSEGLAGGKAQDWLKLTQVGGTEGLGRLGAIEDVFPPARAGRNVAGYLDDTNRVSAFIAKRLQQFEPEAARLEVIKAHYDFNQLTNFERTWMRRLFPFYCVPETAKILTRDGWKNCDGLSIGEEVLTYNQDKDCLEWQACQNKAIFPHRQSLLHFQTKRKGFSFTPEHRWPVQQNPQHIKHSYGEYFYPSQMKVVAGRDLGDKHSFIQSAPFLGTESILTPDQARLLGWIMTDGYFRFRGNHCEVLLFQHPKKFLTEVVQIAGGKPRKPHPDNGTVTVPVVQGKVAEIRSYFDKDNLIKVVTRLSRPAAEAMFDAMYKADGTVTAGRKGDHFAKEHPGIRAAFRILALLVGKNTSEGKRGCYINRCRFLKRASGRLTWEFYEGRVWCPQTANGTWIMKQGTTIIITGNSWSKANVPAVARELMERPGGPVAQAIRVGTEARGQEPGFIPPYLGAGAVMKLGPEVQGQQRFLSRTGLPLEDIGELLQFPLGTGILGQLNPLLKVGPELATGKQFYSGRELADLHSYLSELSGENLRGVENVLMNSPLGRVLTTARTILDPRKEAAAKLFNLGTGFKVTDIDLARQRLVGARELAERMLRGEPGVSHFERVYVKPENRAQLSPQEMQLYQLYQGLENRLRQRQ